MEQAFCYCRKVGAFGAKFKPATLSVCGSRTVFPDQTRQYPGMLLPSFSKTWHVQNSGYQHFGCNATPGMLIKKNPTIGRKPKCNSIFAAPRP
jgi:hypothetical protein